MHSCLSCRILHRQSRTSIEHRSYLIFLFITTFWATLPILVRLTSSNLIFLVSSPNAGASCCCLLVLGTKLFLNSCVSITFCNLRNASSFPYASMSMRLRFLEFSDAYFDFSCFSQLPPSLITLQSLVNSDSLKINNYDTLRTSNRI